MKSLDLHGIRHFEAHDIVEDFILTNKTPIQIITGNSNKMKTIVGKVLKEYNLSAFYNSPYNLGNIIVVEKHNTI